MDGDYFPGGVPLYTPQQQFMANAGAARATAAQLRANADPNIFTTLLRAYADNPIPRGRIKQIATDAAMGFMPMGSIRAFHGSPYSFDAFDMSKIGTGEGAQAYGHGLYFAQAEDVARDYKSTLSRRNIDVTLDGKPITDWGPTVDNLEKQDWRVSKLLGDYGRTGGPLPDFIQRQRDWYRGDKPMEEALDKFVQRVQSTWTPGHMYEVNIAAEPHQLLDWDKPLSEQNAITARVGQGPINYAQSRIGRENPLRGDSFYLGLAGKLGSEYPGATKGYNPPPGFNPHAEASQALRDAGIPGLQYLDQGSRNVQLIPPNETVHGQWLVKQIPNGRVVYRGPDEAAARAAYDTGVTRNYVIWDPSIITILRKYGIPGVIATGGAAAIPGGVPQGGYQ